MVQQVLQGLGWCPSDHWFDHILAFVTQMAHRIIFSRKKFQNLFDWEIQLQFQRYKALSKTNIPLGLFFMIGSGSGHCSSLMFNRDAKSFSHTSMFPGKLAFVMANADSKSSFFIYKMRCSSSSCRLESSIIANNAICLIFFLVHSQSLKDLGINKNLITRNQITVYSITYNKFKEYIPGT